MQPFRKLFLSSYPAVIVLLAAVFLFPSTLHAAPKKKFVVVIDAGHGGSDHGAIENGINEKDVNLAVAQKLGALIKKKLKDTEVVYTRSSDNFISLQKRADIANSAKADLFISIHCNSVDRTNKNRANVTGATTYVLGHHKDNDNLAVARRENSVVELDADDSSHYSQFDPSSDESHIIFEMTQKKNFQNSIRFAADVQREMSAIGRVSRGVQQAGFWVLWSTAAPAALIELDFICNPQQARFLNSKEGQDKLAGAIFNAVKNYESYFRMSLGMAQASAKDDDTKDDTTKDGKKQADGNAELLAQEIPATRSSSSSDTPGGMAELPSGDADKARTRKHRTETAQTRKPSSNSHRRRSSGAREQGGSQIEQAEIVMSEELASNTVDASPTEAPANAAQKKEANKKNGDGKKKQSSEVSRPGRRDKDKKSARKGKKQSVNVDYRVLLFVSDEELKANDEAFKGLSPVASFRENNQFKYTYGESEDRKEMEGLLREISSLFPDARVIKCYY